MKRSFIFYSSLILIFIGTTSFLVNQYVNGVHQLKKLDNEIKSQSSTSNVTMGLISCSDGTCNYVTTEEYQ